MKSFSIVQNSMEWLKLRAGIVTASNVHKIITPKTMKLSEQHRGYMARLLLEWIVGQPILDEDETLWMRAGSDQQDQAMRAYAFSAGVEASPAGFYTTDDGLVGASPDGLVGNRGLVEIKGRKPELHLMSLLWQDSFLASHLPQVQAQLYVCEDRDFDDLCCFPLAATPLPSFYLRCVRDRKWQDALGSVLPEFNEALLGKRLWLDREYGPFKRVEERQVKQAIGSLGITDEDMEALIASKFPKVEAGK